jgi:predicted RNA binding protein YcfA (HicA-like mRNA interferase family)
MVHQTKKGTLTVPVHGSKEIGKGLANKILKAARLK